VKNFSIVLLLILVIFGTVILTNRGYRTIEEAIYSSNPNRVKIVYEEKTKEGSIVFSTIDDTDLLDFSLVKKNILGKYKVDYSGTNGEMYTTLENQGILINYFPAIKKAWTPKYMGLVEGEDIDTIRVIQSDNENYKEGKVININIMKVWIVDVKGLTGSDFNIIGLSEDGKEMINMDDSIGPWTVEQEPLEAYPYY
jgi:hypothetical protein